MSTPRTQPLAAPRTKTRGQVFTPPYLVRLILDYAGYTPGHILRRHIIDNSCGDGAFLVEIVRRYAEEFKWEGGDLAALAGELAEYVHGIEIEAEAHAVCLARLDAEAAACGVEGVAWDVCRADALATASYNGRMDFVVGNPPYVRVHNLDNYDAVKRFAFAAGGMTDLFIVFFELGFRMLAPSGRMCIITPSSWLGSRAGAVLRRHILWQRNLSGLIDLQHFMPFAATTYTLISRFEGRATPCADIDYNTYDGTLHPVCHLTLRDISIGSCFYLADTAGLEMLRGVREAFTEPRVVVKNGYATLADKVFIADDLPDESCVIPVVKASTGRWSRCVFPYDNTGRPLSLQELARTSPRTAAYLLGNKERLLARDAETEAWHLFGRSQAIKDTFRRKYAVNSIVRNAGDVKLEVAEAGQGVYGGLYILTREPFEAVAAALRSEQFSAYVAMLKNYKSGGYYTFSSRDLELFLNHQLAPTHEQLRIS